MPFGMNLSNLPRISSYEEALAWLEHSRRQLTGREKFWTKDMVPLDGKRKESCRLHLLLNNDIAMALYETDMIRYSPDGTVYISCYDSRASAEFVSNLCPQGISARMFNQEMWIEVNTLEGEQYVQPNDESIVLTPLSEGVWSVAGQYRRKVARIKFRKLPKIRKMAQPISEQLQAFRRLGGAKMYRSGTCPVKAIKDYLAGQGDFIEAFGSHEPEDIVGLLALAEDVVEIADADYSQPPRKPVPMALSRQLTVLSTSHELEYV